MPTMRLPCGALLTSFAVFMTAHAGTVEDFPLFLRSVDHNGTSHYNGTNATWPDPMPFYPEILPPSPDDLPVCDQNYATIEDLDAASMVFPDYCRALYAIQTLSNVFNAAIANYTDLMNDGYDGKFDTYSHAVADNAGQTVRDFVNGHGPDYFTCVVTEATVCCDYCDVNPPEQCNHCWDGDCYTNDSPNKRDTASNSLLGHSARFGHMGKRESGGGMGVGSSGTQGPWLVINQDNFTEPCPPDYSQRAYGPTDPYEQSVYWTLNADRTDQFFADLMDNTGIPQDKIQFQDWNRGNTCSPAEQDDPAHDSECWGNGFDYGMPTPVDYTPEDVANPKDVVSKALENSNSLVTQINDALFEAQLHSYIGDQMELVDTISLPVLMIAEAIENMAMVESVAEEIEEEQKKAMIMGFLSAVLFLIPVAGEVLGAVSELSTLAAVISVLGEAGNAAMDIYTIVDDPNNAPLAIFGLVMEPLALADIAKVSQAANIRRGMADEDLLKLGTRVHDRMGSIKKVTGTCCKTD